MAGEDLRNHTLLGWYYRYVGEPERMRDVYGYWLFLLGCICGLVGIATYLLEQALVPGDLAIREVAIISGAVGLPIALLGIVVLLPVRRRGIIASIVGGVIAFVGVGLFWWVYPHAWYVSTDYSAEVIAVYGTGITIMAAVAVLVPIITGEKGLFVEPELGIGRDQPPILVGKATEDAFFAIYETPVNDWTWRMVHRNAIAESQATAPTDTDARLLVEDARDIITGAGLLDLTTSSFRLYQTEDDQWRWSLVRQDGSVVAVSNETSPSRDDVETVVTFLSDHLPGADILEIHGAAFDVYQDEAERWRWRMVDDRRNVLAESPDGMRTESEASQRIEGFVDRFVQARVLALKQFGFELFETSDGWGWRVVTPTDETIVTSHRTAQDRQAAEAAAKQLADRIPDAPVVDSDTPGFELVPDGGPWTWRLRDETDDILLDAAERGDQAHVRDRAERAQSVLPTAEIIEYDEVDFEVYPEGDGWHWRLVSEDREVLAESVEPFEDREAVTESAENVKACVLAADLIEFEEAAFQQYESDGEWRWRLIDDDGQVLADSGEEYGSQEAVREGMTTLKEHAPDADVIEIETAAFEIYRTDGGEFAWRLIDEGGKLIAEGASLHPSRRAARDAVSYLTDHVGTTSVRAMENVIIQLFQTDDRWGGRLVDIDGTILATTRESTTTLDAAREVSEEIRDIASDAGIDVLGDVYIKLRNGSGWRWDVIEAPGDRLGSGERTYDAREQAMDDINTLTQSDVDAPVFVLDDGIIWSHADAEGEGWHWRLVGPDRTSFGVAGRSYPDLDGLLADVERIKTRAPDATEFEIDTVAFEIVRDEEVWSWRVLDEDETVLAVDPGSHVDRREVDVSIERAKDATEGASILKIDDPAFEFHEREDGWIWRLIDASGTPVAESIEAHETRQEAREQIRSAKEHGPEGETVVTW